MKSRIAAVVTCLLLATYVLAQEPSAEQPKTDQVIRHVVLLKFKKEAPAEKVIEIEAAFAGLASKIDEVVELEWGNNSSPEGLNKGFTHCFLVTFDSPADRDAYLVHPQHKAFVALLRPYLEEALVLDYTPEGVNAARMANDEG